MGNKTERIDFTTLDAERCIVTKFHRSDDKRRDILHSKEIKTATDFNLHDAIEWCEHNDFVVYTWYDESGRQHARAFLGEPWPIRTGWQIMRLREKLEAMWRGMVERGEDTWAIKIWMAQDLAYAG